VLRSLSLAGLVVLTAAAAGADVIHFKDGTTKRVEVYHESATYVCYIDGGKLAGSARSTIKKIDYEDEEVYDVKKILARKKAEREGKEKKRQLSAIELLRQKYGRGGDGKGEDGEKKTAEEKKKAARARLLEKAFRPGSGSSSSSSEAPPRPTSGTDYIPAGKSETGESEMIVDPFPAGRSSSPRRRRR